MGLFSDIYNTVAKFFRPQEEQGDASKSVATNRLKLVLMQDRTNLTPKILEQMRSELIELLSRYVEMDKELLELNFEQEGDQVALMLSIPVIRAKDEDEIEAALKEKFDETENTEVVEDDSIQSEDEDSGNEQSEDEEFVETESCDNSDAEDTSDTSTQHVSTPDEISSPKAVDAKEHKKEISQD